jgi:hypothetical protein
MHRIVTGPLSTRGDHPGPIEIRFGRGVVAILAGGKLIQCTGGATGTWPTTVVLDDPAVLDKLRQPRDVAKIEITYIDGALDVQVAEMRKPRPLPAQMALSL